MGIDEWKLAEGINSSSMQYLDPLLGPRAPEAIANYIENPCREDPEACR